MKLNQINPKSITKISDAELLNLHFRTHQLAAQFLRREELDHPKLINLIIKHKIITHEMISRGMRYKIVDALDEIAHPDIDVFIDRFVDVIPAKLSELTKKELVKLHNQLHSVWEVVHLRMADVVKQEQLWNWHRLVERALLDRGVEVPTNWDSLDKPLGRALSSIGYARTFPSGEELGPWIFQEDLISHIPNELLIIENAALVDIDKRLIWLTDSGGQQLMKVIYFRVLRQFPRSIWINFRAAALEELESIDVTYSLVLKKMSPPWTVQLSLQFENLCLVKPYLYIVGGLATQGASKNDIDIMLRKGLSAELESEIFRKFVAQFPEWLQERFSLVEDNGLSPFTSYLGVCSLDLIRMFYVDLETKIAKVEDFNED